MQVRHEKIAIFDQYLALSRKWYNRAILTKLHRVLDSVISNDLE